MERGIDFTEFILFTIKWAFLLRYLGDDKHWVMYQQGGQCSLKKLGSGTTVKSTKELLLLLSLGFIDTDVSNVEITATS